MAFQPGARARVQAEPYHGRATFDVRALEYELCQECGRKKYHPIIECGYSPPIVGTSVGADAVKSREIFGSGGKAFRHIYFSQDLFQAIQKASLKGGEFYPVGESESCATDSQQQK